jgi:hypothetical protein
MSSLASLLSKEILQISPAEYTSPGYVSAMTGGEISPADVQPEWIEAATEEIDRRSGMCFRAKQFVNILDGDNSNVIFLDCFPILEIYSITIDGEVLEPDRYSLNKKTGTIKLKNLSVRSGYGNIVVQGAQGYSEVPPLVHKIATLIVTKTALSAKFMPLADNDNIGDFSQTRSFKKLNDELDRAWAALGKRFRIYTL